MASVFWWCFLALCIQVAAMRMHNERLPIFAIALAMRVLAIGLSHTRGLNPFNSGDSLYFERVASARAERSSALELFLNSDWLQFGNRWITLLAFLFGIGMSTIQVEMINAIVSSLAIALLRPIGSQHTWIWYFLAAWPITAGLHGSLLREAPVFAAAAVAALYLIDRRVSYPSAVAASAVSGLLHPGLIPLFVVTAASGPKTNRERQAGYRIAGIGTIVAIGVVVVALVVSGFGLERLDNQEIQGAAFEARFARASRGRLAYSMPSLVSFSPAGVLYLPLRILFFLGGPTINRVGSPGDLIAALDGFIFIAGGAALVYRMMRTRRSLAGVALIASIVIFASVVSNFGTAFRHRQKLLPIAVAAAVASGALERERDEADEPAETDEATATHWRAPPLPDPGPTAAAEPPFTVPGPLRPDQLNMGNGQGSESNGTHAQPRAPGSDHHSR